MLTIHKGGGLGNQLFMLAATESIAQASGRQFYFDNFDIADGNPHSPTNYMNTVFKRWRQFHRPASCEYKLCESKYMYSTPWAHIVRSRPEKDIRLQGYFQRWEYIQPIRERFIERLSFNTDILKQYPDIQKYMFVHVRGGDYIGSSLHHVDLRDYYKKCLDLVHPQQLILFTNDKPYAMTIMEGRSCIIPDVGEEDALLLMSKCKGGILGNSTFAWWGAYMNPNRQIFMPSKWFLDPKYDPSGYFFPGATVVEV